MSEIVRWFGASRIHHIISGRTRQRLHFDGYLTILILILCTLGLTVLYSALDQDIRAFSTQLTRIIIGLALFVVAVCIRKDTYYWLAPVIYSGTIALLIAVWFYGDVSQGSKRWLDFPGLPRFQPSELLKISLPLIIGWYFAIRKFKNNLLDIFWIGILFGVPILLIFLQPDYGTAMILCAGTIGVLFVVGFKWWWFAVGGCSVLVATPFIWNFVLYPYHRRRILTLFNPESDPLDSGWNIIQSKTAIGSGGFSGKGLFNGTQSRLDFIPEGHTDFVLAVSGEELGFIFCTCLLLLYLLIFVRAMYISKNAESGFGFTVGSGICIIFICNVVVNVAMVLGLLPIIGLPLPLISYGGSSAITTMVAFGVLLSVCTRKENRELT